MPTPRQHARRNLKARRVQGTRAYGATDPADTTTAYPSDAERADEWDESVIKILSSDPSGPPPVLQPEPPPDPANRRLTGPPPPKPKRHRRGGIADEMAVRKMTEATTGFSVFARLRPRRQPVNRSPAEPRSQVRVLRSDSEVHEAVERAVGPDQVAQDALSRRIDRYKSHEAEATAEVMPFPDAGASTRLQSGPHPA